MAETRVKIGSIDLGLSLEIIEVGWDCALTYEREDESANYRLNPDTEFLISCKNMPAAWDTDPVVAFQILLDAETDCNTFQVVIEQKCAGVWASVWEGTFQSKEWKSDRTKKTIRVKPKEPNALDCIRDVWKEVQNPFGLPAVEVRPTYLGYELTQDLVVLNDPDGTCAAPPGMANFCYLDLVRTAMPDLGITLCAYLYHRYIQAGSCTGATAVEPDGYNTWTLVTNNCPTSSTWWYCPTDGRVPHTFPNGRLFNDVLELLIPSACGLTVVSNFFGINPDATEPTNDAYTAAAAYCQNLVIFQKSDVKRHDASDPSKQPAWDMTLEDLWADIKAMFNLDWRIEGAILRIEHVSYFEATPGNNYTTAFYKRELEQDKSDVPAVVRFKYRDDYATTYFKGYPITTYCGEGEEDVQLRLFSTDVVYITSVDGLENIGDDGFVLFAAVEGPGAQLYNIDNNRGLSWTKLHENFHRHNMAGAGTINDVNVVPLSVKPTRRQPAFTVKHCCDDNFDPVDLVTTALGDGQVQKATWNLAKETLNIELKY